VKPYIQRCRTYATRFLRRYWLGTVLILVATLVFFWPVVTRIGTYSEGGDAMFNAWTLARDHHCLQFEGCPTYADGNIYFPNKNSMFYSETQLSAGLLTLPLHWIDPNPIFAYNLWTIASFFFAGWFMYLLAKRLSRGNECMAILAGLAFEFAPFKMAAVTHLQSLSIFYLPLAVLLIIRYLDSAAKRYLAGLFVTLALLFYGSWYQMMFSLIGISALLVVLFAAKQATWKQVRGIGIVVALAVVSVAPLALQYIQFSKSNNATFTLGEQVHLSSSLADYVLPHNGTAAGKVYYHFNPGSQINAFNLDSFSYHGVVLYTMALVLMVCAITVLYKTRNGKRTGEGRAMHVWVIGFAAVALVGLVVSLGPILKVQGSYTYGEIMDGVKLAVPLPWLAVDYALPQLHFIRAIGRASVLVLFGLCSMLAFLPAYMHAAKLKTTARYAIIGGVAALMVFELMPLHRVPMSINDYSYNLHIPDIYKRVAADSAIDNLIVLRSDKDYPGAPIPIARTEDVLWAGYHNKRIFNGYSGFTPPDYFKNYADYVDLHADDIPKMKRIGLRYVIVDKKLSQHGTLTVTARSLFPDKIYEDQRYVLFKL
jgi:hypothetical protein